MSRANVMTYCGGSNSFASRSHPSSRRIQVWPNAERYGSSLDVYPASRLVPDLQIGLVHIKSGRRLDQVVALVTQIAAEHGATPRAESNSEPADPSRVQEMSQSYAWQSRCSSRSCRPGHVSTSAGACISGGAALSRSC